MCMLDRPLENLILQTTLGRLVPLFCGLEPFINDEPETEVPKSHSGWRLWPAHVRSGLALWDSQACAHLCKVQSRAEVQRKKGLCGSMHKKCPLCRIREQRQWWKAWEGQKAVCVCRLSQIRLLRSDHIVFINWFIDQLIDVFIPGSIHSMHTYHVLSHAGGWE